MNRLIRSNTTPRAARAAAITADPRWASVRARDPSAAFFYSVSTTGVFCRPSCGARRPRPEHVEFHASAAAAARAGFRPCKRCKPDAPPKAATQATLVASLCRRLEDDPAPSLAALAIHAGMSPGHTLRLFKAVTGVTPRAYAEARRAGRVRGELRRRATVTEAIYAAGFGSATRFYEQSERLLGMTPAQYRDGAPGLALRRAFGTCSLGHVLVATSDRGVCAILLGDAPATLERETAGHFPGAARIEPDPQLADLLAAVITLIEDPRAGARLPLDIRGTAFQQRVWQAIAKIPAGQTLSYAELAAKIGSPKAARAVARACAANRLAVAIPCHRVVGKDGALAGYRWGVARKQALLRRES